MSWKQHIEIISKISKSIGILYKSRDALSKQCLKQIYFSFIHNYVNYANIAWASTGKSKLGRLYGCQKYAARVIYCKDRYTHASPLLNDMKTFNVFQLNIFNILCFMYSCKQNLNPPVFRNNFTHRIKTKSDLRNENSIKNLYAEKILVLYFCTVDPTFGSKIVISKSLTFSESDSLQAFKPEPKRFLLSLELNDLEILQ